jgi:hypothetical protein
MLIYQRLILRILDRRIIGCKPLIVAFRTLKHKEMDDTTRKAANTQDILPTTRFCEYYPRQGHGLSENKNSLFPSLFYTKTRNSLL